MEIRINTDDGTATVAIPAAAIDVLPRAGETDLRVLLVMCADPTLRVFDDRAEGMERIAVAAGCHTDDVQDALAFWRGAGVCSTCAGTAKATRVCSGREPRSAAAPAAVTPVAATPANATTTVPATEGAEVTPAAAAGKPRPKSELPRYTTEELTTLLETRKDAAECLDECQRIWGKMFNTHEVNMILGLVDYLGLDWEYVLVLLAYCHKVQEKRGLRSSLHYVETTAFSLYDDGVCDVAALHERIKRNEQMAEMETRLRALFGMGSRTLTPTEKKYFATWLYEYKYDMDIIRRAYEITVDSKGEFKIKYMNSILANWHSDGLHTLEDIDRAQAAFRAESDRTKSIRSTSGGTGRSTKANGMSYDVQDFFDAAVRRSLGDDFADQVAGGATPDPKIGNNG